MVAGFHQLARRPDQDIRVPDRGHAVLGDGLDADGDRPRLKIDRLEALGFGQAEERIGHQVLRVARRNEEHAEHGREKCGDQCQVLHKSRSGFGRFRFAEASIDDNSGTFVALRNDAPE